jgi:hemimethylated DNA binding protein
MNAEESRWMMTWDSQRMLSNSVDDNGSRLTTRLLEHRKEHLHLGTTTTTTTMTSLLLSRSGARSFRAASQTSFFSAGLLPQSQRLLSSSPPPSTPPPAPPTASSSSSSDRLSRTLYRQLLQWCNRRQELDGTVPLSFVIPPIHIAAPEQVDSYRLELLAHNFYTFEQHDQLDKDQQHDEQQGKEQPTDAVDVQRARQLLPARTIVEPKYMTVPLDSVAELKGLFGAVYRLNRRKESDHHKARIAAAFDALKSLNQLTGGLDTLTEQRQQHVDRTGVEFSVGQVVQNKQERWRGVIAGWHVEATTTVSSLTTKVYGLDEFSSNTSDDADADADAAESEPGRRVSYDVIIDAGDATSMASSSGWSKTSQSNLVPVTDSGLARIRSKVIPEYFSRFDSTTQSFVPNALLAHGYPNDNHASAEDSATATDATTTDESQPNVSPPAAAANHSPETIQLCDDIVTGVQELASRLERIILDESSCPAERKMQLLADTQAQLARITAGDVVPAAVKLQSPETVTPLSLATLHLRALLNLSLETQDILFQRQTSVEHVGKLRFAIGDIVHHKFFDFRGVVVAWDPKPSIDVSRWDGLGHIDNPNEIPFYHVIPDQRDCVEAFGGERPMRYVCEENLEECLPNRKMIDVDLEPEWERDPADGSYVAPAELRFKYGEDLEDEGATERCLLRIQDELAKWQVGARASSSDDPVTDKLSVKNLHGLLLVVETLNDAVAVQETIKEIRNAHRRRDLRWQLDQAVGEMMGGKSEAALATFRTLVEEDPEYAEAWNKMSTSKYLSGNLDESQEAAEKVLEIDPLHFQALNGLGLIYFQKEDYPRAIESFRKSISIDPWSAVPSKLSVCIDLLEHTGGGQPDQTGGSD